jgi:hypothetical protein
VESYAKQPGQRRFEEDEPVICGYKFGAAYTVGVFSFPIIL